MNADIVTVLQSWIRGEQPTSKQWQYLLSEEMAIPQRAKAFNVTKENGLEKIEARSRLFLQVDDEVIQLCQKSGFKQIDTILTTLWQLWLPLAMQLAEERSKLKRPLIQGILGGQGTGKTTLAQVLILILRHLGCNTIGVSIDDLYKTYADRQKLLEEDPRLKWRGPPGTHDVTLGIELLDRVCQCDCAEPILIPRFDKSLWNGAGDRIAPAPANQVDLVLFEGWFVGAIPVDESVFENPPAPIITPEDKQFAKDTNERLKEYLPLWERLDRLIVLCPVDYRLSKQWRKEAEQKLKVASGKEVMSEDEIDCFVEYFWRSLHPELFITPLTKNPNLVDLVVEINADRRLGRLYQPGD
ncbi:glycerate kinase [Candidatus Gracilibacteria bacterium]|nr:glycerate kinase [Candidatus Gracilibacteria bacterium]NJM89644.1 glycerate kinase [Hydrococcus sp. RU_2_2]NJP20676.1 glycerate kinase [Hydrococcus sp. CRU_1_1]